MQFIKGAIVLLSKCFDNTIRVVGILGLIWGISAIFELASSTSNGANVVSFERALWLSGGIVLLIVFVISFAFYTYRYCTTKPKIKIRSIEERISDLERERQLIKDNKEKRENPDNLEHKSKTEARKIETNDKTIGYFLLGTALVASLIWAITRSQKAEKKEGE